jgi:hypothetical protein
MGALDVDEEVDRSLTKGRVLSDGLSIALVEG